MAIVALGTAEFVSIMEARPNSYTEFLKIERPTYYFNRSSQQLERFKAMMPSLSWGHGMSPS